MDTNQLTSLPSEIGKLTNLLELDLDENELTPLPSEIGKLSMLEILDLQANQLTSLPSDIGRLSNLEVFYHDSSVTMPEEIQSRCDSFSLICLDGW